MGYRTTVILSNDHHHEWSKDPNLGQNISRAMNFANSRAPADSYQSDIGYGRVVECVHADQQTLAVLDSYYMHPIVSTSWAGHEPIESVTIKLLRAAADKLGFRLVRKTK